MTTDAMIPLTTKLPAICSLLQRVLEMENSAMLGPWTLDEHSQEFIIAANGLIVVQEHDCHLSTMEFIVSARNITKPQATALLLAIESLQKIHDQDTEAVRMMEQTMPNLVPDKATYEGPLLAIQSIADAFPDALFTEQDISERLGISNSDAGEPTP